MSNTPLPDPYGQITTHTLRDQQFFYRWPDPPYLDNAKECIRVYTREHMHAHAAAVSAADNSALREQVQALQSEVIRATNFELDAGRVMRHEPMLNGFEDLWVIEAEFDALREWVKVLEDALQMCVEQFQKPFQLHVSEGDLQALDAARAALGDKTCSG